MHRFLIFGGSEYYPSGGVNDLLGTEDSKVKAIAKAGSMMGGEFAVNREDFKTDPEYATQSTVEWVHVYDTQIDEIVYKEEGSLGDARVIFVGGSSDD